MARPPNYKQNKQRREEAQRKRNELEQLRKAARKEAPLVAPAKSEVEPHGSAADR